jgi:hypothetical protein
MPAPEEKEPSPLHDPPEGVEIPVETPFGDNLPLPPSEGSRDGEHHQENGEEHTSTPHDAPNPGSGHESGGETPTNSNEETEGGVLFLGIFPILGIALLIFIAGVIAGSLVTKTKLNDTMTSNPQKGKVINPKGVTPEKTQIMNVMNAAGEEQSKQDAGGDKQRTGFIQDRGVYERVNAYSSEDILKKRLPLAKKSIVWITGEPQTPDVLAGLSAIKNERNIPIFIITGKDTEVERIKRAQQYGFPIHTVNKSLELPYSIILIDNKLVLDVSRVNWIWETTEKNIIRDTANWANELIESAKIYQ